MAYRLPLNGPLNAFHFCALRITYWRRAAGLRGVPEHGRGEDILIVVQALVDEP